MTVRTRNYTRGLIFTVIALTSCDASPSKDAEDRSVDERAAFIMAAKDAAARDLIDPPTAQFRDLTIGDVQGRRTLCGEINGKNRFGAYTGFTGFQAVSMGDGSISGTIASDNRTTEQAHPCIASWQEREPKAGEQMTREDYRQIDELGVR